MREKMKKLVVICFTIIGVLHTSTAFAGCPRMAPKISFPLSKGDQKVSGKFVKKLVVGKKLNYGGTGSSFYLTNGKYYWEQGNKRTYSEDYKFYKNGVRCFDYEGDLSFVKFVVNDKRLVAIQKDGGRYIGRISK